MSSCDCNWVFRINNGWHCSYNCIVGVAMSLILGKPFSTTVASSGFIALSGGIAFFNCIDLLDFIKFLVALFGASRNGVVITARQFQDHSCLPWTIQFVHNTCWQSAISFSKICTVVDMLYSVWQVLVSLFIAHIWNVVVCIWVTHTRHSDSG